MVSDNYRVATRGAREFVRLMTGQREKQATDCHLVTRENVEDFGLFSLARGKKSKSLDNA